MILCQLGALKVFLESLMSFCYQGHAMSSIDNAAWRTARSDQWYQIWGRILFGARFIQTMYDAISVHETVHSSWIKLSGSGQVVVRRGPSNPAVSLLVWAEPNPRSGPSAVGFIKRESVRIACPWRSLLSWVGISCGCRERILSPALRMCPRAVCSTFRIRIVFRRSVAPVQSSYCRNSRSTEKTRLSLRESRVFLVGVLASCPPHPNPSSALFHFALNCLVNLGNRRSPLCSFELDSAWQTASSPRGPDLPGAIIWRLFVLIASPSPSHSPPLR